MPFSPIHFLEAFMLALAVSMDAFVSSFAYGSSKIKIPMLSVQIINLVCSCILGLSLLAGSWVRNFLPDWLTVFICFFILFVLGVVKFFDSITKSIIRRHNHFNRAVKFSMFNFHFILSLYADPEAADVDASQSISAMEAASLALALSLDGIAVGFGAALGDVSIWAVLLCSFVTGGLAVILGCRVGNRVAGRLPFDISWLGGAMLIILALIKLF